MSFPQSTIRTPQSKGSEMPVAEMPPAKPQPREENAMATPANVGGKAPDAAPKLTAENAENRREENSADLRAICGKSGLPRSEWHIDHRRRLCQPSWSAQEIASIEKLAELKDMDTDEVVRQALRLYQAVALDACSITWKNSPL